MREQAKANANAKISGRFGKKGTGSGNTQGDEVKGSPDGNSYIGATSGVGGNGESGVSAQVGTRVVQFLSKPTYADQTKEGTVVVAIKVNKAGKVTNAEVTHNRTGSSLLAQEAVKAALKSSFSAGEIDNESGTITYRFKQR